MRKLWIAGLVLAILGLLLYSISGTQPTKTLGEAYLAKLRETRRQKDQTLHNAADSPIPGAQRATFAGLRYFAPVADFRVTASIKRLPVLLPQPLAMSLGAPESYQRWGTAEFELNGKPQKLTLLQKAGDKQLFVPFTDPTNGEQTYGAGRYIDVPLPPAEANEVELDFNQAYNPYCAYNHDYSCPLPLAENRLTVPVVAGEQAFQL
ncbi:MAG TPA: DUF1684 domain-containing protein [Hymenobacter sp.]|uniref:DUF1684 domain-containing protein n=1 Tax=Hymenobacter sp. TaxID=1898978 RepID=UPI002D810E34|nr:DUF1684 domain-containing protein [Hymenobacter sp.]HET9503926.1 DUF1684 domain-containing protein [Hymenobacter sp.]